MKCNWNGGPIGRARSALRRALAVDRAGVLECVTWRRIRTTMRFAGVLAALGITLLRCGGIAEGPDGGRSGSLSETGTTQRCPIDAPSSGSKCDNIGIDCEYGSSPDPSCNQVFHLHRQLVSGSVRKHCPWIPLQQLGIYLRLSQGNLHVCRHLAGRSDRRRFRSHVALLPRDLILREPSSQHWDAVFERRPVLRLRRVRGRR